MFVDDFAILVQDRALQNILVVVVLDIIRVSLVLVSVWLVPERLLLLSGRLTRVWELFPAVRGLRLLGVGDKDTDGLGGFEVDQDLASFIEVVVDYE